MALFDSTVRPSQQASDIGGLRGKLLNSVFPGVIQTPVAGTAPAPTGPVSQNPATRTRAQAPLQQSAASRAAAAVAAKIAASPKNPPVVAPVQATRANTLPTQSAGTINTNYVASAAAQGYNNVTPPNIFRGMRESTRGYDEGKFFPSGSITGGMYAPAGLWTNARDPNRTRESFRGQVFTPSPAQVRANLFSAPVPGASAILQQPLAPQVGVPAAQFPPRSQFLNFLFPNPR